MRPRTSDGESLEEGQDGAIVLIQMEIRPFHVAWQDADKFQSHLEPYHAAPGNESKRTSSR